MIIAPPAAEAGRNCPDGTSYHKIRVGGLIKRTVAEGCFTSYEAAQLRMQADANHQQAYRDWKRQHVNNNRMRQCFGNARSYGNTTYGNATCF